MNSKFSKIMPHLIAVAVIFIAISLYFTPLFGGKVLRQYDVLQWKSTYQEISQFEQKTGERTYWTNSIFGGMPSYLIGASYSGNITGTIAYYLSAILQNPIDTIFILYISFYILMLTFEVDSWLAIVGALAFTFSTFNFLNLDTGHLTKGNAIGFMPLVLAGINLTLKKNKLLGAALTGIAVSFEVSAGHLQITYYLVFIILAWMITEFIFAIRNNQFKSFLQSALLLLVAALLGVSTNITNLLTTMEYDKYSIRSRSELTKTPDGKTTELSTRDGLDKDYAMSWSNGVTEPFTLLVPNFMGGASSGELSPSSETFEVLKSNGVPNPKEVIKQMPVYWGQQPYTAGPIYYGAIVVFLFAFGMFFLKSRDKWWVFIVSLLAIFLSMGKNFSFLSDLFFEYFPLYNKFRSVTFILCVTQTTFPLLAVFTLSDLIKRRNEKAEIYKAIKYSLYVVGGLLLLFIFLPGILCDFIGIQDEQIRKNFPALVDALVKDRESILRMDALRSLVFIGIAIGLIWAFLNDKIKNVHLAWAFALLITFDLWQVDKRYLNDKDFEKKKGEAVVEKTAVDEQILQDPDIHYRVYNNTTDFDKDALTAYYHKSIGGYHGAKMRRFQELIEWQLARNNMECYNMLNVKYIIVSDSTQQRFAQRNPNNNGNAWFVNNIHWVKNADEEIVALNTFKSKEEAIIDERFKETLGAFQPTVDSSASIKLNVYQPNKLVYQSQSNSPQLAVFSEIFYDKGWNAYIDGALVPHVRVDYVLRGLQIPAGKHEVVFKFEPQIVKTGETIAWASSLLLYASVIFSLVIGFRKKNTV